MAKKGYNVDTPIEWKDWIIISFFSLALCLLLAWIGLALPSQSEPGADAQLNSAGVVIYGYGHMEGQHFVRDDSGPAKDIGEKYTTNKITYFDPAG